MITVIGPHQQSAYSDDMQAMYRLRYNVFKVRLSWDVPTSGDWEFDWYDTLGPYYLLCKNEDGDVAGCVRLLPTEGPYMLRDTFPQLLAGQPVPASPRIWEASRFAINTSLAESESVAGLRRTTCALLAAGLEFGLIWGLESFAVVVDLRMERILRLAGLPITRLGAPYAMGHGQAVAGSLQVSEDALERILQRSELTRSAIAATMRQALATNISAGSVGHVRACPSPRKGPRQRMGLHAGRIHQR